MSVGLGSLSVTQALSLWSDLCDAYHGKNDFGGNVAEVYLYQTMSHEPMAAHIREAQAEQVKGANEALYAVLAFFAEKRDCRISVNGKPLGEWLRGAGFDHRVHVEVLPCP